MPSRWRSKPLPIMHSRVRRLCEAMALRRRSKRSRFYAKGLVGYRTRNVQTTNSRRWIKHLEDP